MRGVTGRPFFLLSSQAGAWLFLCIFFVPACCDKWKTAQTCREELVAPPEPWKWVSSLAAFGWIPAIWRSYSVVLWGYTAPYLQKPETGSAGNCSKNVLTARFANWKSTALKH